MFTLDQEKDLRDIADALDIQLQPHTATRPNKAYIAHHPKHQDLHIYLNHCDRVAVLNTEAQLDGSTDTKHAYILDDLWTIKNALLEWKTTGKLTTNRHWAFAIATVEHFHSIGARLAAEGLIKAHYGSGEQYSFINNQDITLHLIPGSEYQDTTLVTVDSFGTPLVRILVKNNYAAANRAASEWARNYSVFEYGAESYICEEIDFMHLGRIHTREEIHTYIDQETNELVLANDDEDELRINRYTSPRMGSLYGFRWVTHDKKDPHGYEVFIPSDNKEKIHATVWNWLYGKEESE